MKLGLLTSCWMILLLSLATSLRADILWMKDGRKIEGHIVGHAEGYVFVEVSSGSKKITIKIKEADIREQDELGKDTSNDRLMKEYGERFVKATEQGAEGFRDLAHWCAQSDALADERKSAWRALLGLKPDDEEARAGLGQVKANAGDWESIDQKMAANGFVRKGNTWVRGAAPVGAAAPASNAGNQNIKTAADNVRPSSLLERSGFNALYGGSTGYTTSFSGDNANGTIFYGQTGYPYLSVYDAAGVGIYVPLYNYPGFYYLTLPPDPNSRYSYYRGNNANLTLADRGLTGSFYGETPPTRTVTQNGTTFTTTDFSMPSDQYNSQGYDANGIKVSSGYREPTPPANYTPTGNGNTQVIDANGNVTFEGANFQSHNAMGYDQNGIRQSPNKVVITDAGVVTNGSGYNTYGVYTPPTPAAPAGMIVNGAGYSTNGTMTAPVYASSNSFLVNGAGYTTYGTRVTPFYSNSANGYAVSRYNNFEVDLYGTSRGTNYRVGLNAYGFSLDANGKKGHTAWNLSVR